MIVQYLAFTFFLLVVFGTAAISTGDKTTGINSSVQVQGFSEGLEPTNDLVPRMESIHRLSKRSYWSALACTRHDGPVHNAQGAWVADNKYRWLRADCSVDPNPRRFIVICEMRIRRATGLTVSVTAFGDFCPVGKVCFRRRNSVNFRGERVIDVSCRLAANTKKGPPRAAFDNIITVRPTIGKSTTICSKTMTFPEAGSSSGSSRAGGSVKRRKYVLEQEMTTLNGSGLIVPDLYILDVSSQEPWRRSEAKDVSTNTADLILFGNTIRRLEFCVVLAAGLGYSAFFHYSAREITGISSIAGVNDITGSHDELPTS